MAERRLRSKLFLAELILVGLDILRPFLLGEVKVIQHTIPDVLVELAHVGLQFRGDLLFGERPQHLALLHKLCVILERIDTHVELAFGGRWLCGGRRSFFCCFRCFRCWGRSTKQLPLWGTLCSHLRAALFLTAGQINIKLSDAVIDLSTALPGLG